MVKSRVQPVQVLGGCAAMVLLVVGVVGVTITGVSDWSSANIATVLGLHMPPIRGIGYGAAGLIGLLVALRSSLARLYGWLLVIGFAGLTLWGLAVVGVFASNPVSGVGNPLRLAASDNWWHGAGLLVALVLVALPAHREIVIDEPEDDLDDLDDDPEPDEDWYQDERRDRDPDEPFFPQRRSATPGYR